MKNDYVSTSTTDVPETAKAVGTEVKDEATKTDDVKADESGAPAEIKAEDAVETEQESETEVTDDEAEETDQKDEKAKPKKKGGFQRKLESKDREIEFLREQLARQTQPEQKKESDAKAETKNDKPKPDDYDSQADYLEALTDWKVEQKVKEREEKAKQESVKSEFESRVSKFQTEVKKFSETVDDYEDVIDDASDVMLTVGLQEALLESENGPEILYNLAKNKAELMRINRLSLVAQAREIGKLEAKLSKPEPKPEIKTKTAAPPPPKPVGTKSPGKVIKDPSEMTGDEYIAWKKSRR